MEQFRPDSRYQKADGVCRASGAPVGVYVVGDPYRRVRKVDREGEVRKELHIPLSVVDEKGTMML